MTPGVALFSTLAHSGECAPEHTRRNIPGPGLSSGDDHRAILVPSRRKEVE